MKSKKTWMLVAALACLFLFPAGAFAATFNSVVVFGNSLSDNGNLYEFDQSLFPDPELYYQGHFSNGPVWVEYLTDPNMLNTQLVDRALGGAQTGGHTPPGLLDQIQFQIRTISASPDTLYAIWIGANNYINGNGDATAAVSDIQDGLNTLADYGARQILVLNLPNLGDTPHYLGSENQAQATAYAQNFNAQLSAMLDTFSTAHPEIAIYEFDIYSLFQTIIANPGAYGFVNATQESPNFSVKGNFDGAGYVFWDSLHPTTEAHALIADRVFAMLNEQYQPSGDTTAPPVEADSSSSSCFIGTLLSGM